MTTSAAAATAVAFDFFFCSVIQLVILFVPCQTSYKKKRNEQRRKYMYSVYK